MSTCKLADHTCISELLTAAADTTSVPFGMQSPYAPSYGTLDVRLPFLKLACKMHCAGAECQPGDDCELMQSCSIACLPCILSGGPENNYQDSQA